MTIVDVLSRWTHVGFAVVMLGGSVFLRYVLMPAAKASLTDEQHAALGEKVMGRWKKVVMAGIALLLLSGFYNYLTISIPAHKADPHKGLYHGLMGLKMLLAFGVFFLASVLTGRSPKFEGMRQNRAKWLSVLILLAATVVAIGGYLKVAVPGVKAPVPASALQNSDPTATPLFY